MNAIGRFVVRFASLALVGTSSIEQTVAANYPARLSQIAAKHHYSEQRQQAYVEVTAANKKYIAAGYSNGQLGAVALLEQTGESATVRQTIRDHQTGREPEVSAVDLDADGQAEIIVRFSLGSRGGSQTWVYRIRDGQLVLISPVDKHGSSLLGDPDVVDFEGGGIMDLVDVKNVGASRQEPTVLHTHYALRNGSYVALEPLDFYEIFYRDKRAPATRTASFSIAQGVGKPFRMTVINGGEAGAAYRVSSGVMTLNGARISAPGDFSQERGAWSIPVTLQDDNTMTVRVEGKPQGRIAVAIRHD